MQKAIDPRIPANVKAIITQSAKQTSYLYNGAFYFTEPDNKRNTNASRTQLMPRVGLSWRIGERTALRAGYGRFYTPTSLIMPDRDANGELPMGAYSPTTSALPDVGNVPQVRFSNPFPQSLIDAYSKKHDRYTQLGDSIIIDEHQQKPPISDRINLSLQRELPGRIVADVIYLINFVSRDQWF
jgi:hypothetical protein